MKIGLIFAGQGAQYPGMGKELFDNSDAARAVFNAAGQEVTGWCFEGTPELLKETRVTQPTVYTVSMAAYEAFCEALEQLNSQLAVSEGGSTHSECGSTGPIEIMGIAGFSLGEYAALTAAKSIRDIKKGIEIVQARGLMMNKAGMDPDGNPKGGMVAAIAPREVVLACVEETREDGILCGVNFNGPKQTVVAGDFEALKRFKAAAAEKKIRAMDLSVGTAFHSPMMEPAAAELRHMLLKENLQAPQLKLYCDATARDMMEDKSAECTVGEHIADLMARQAKSPVYWQEIIEHMIQDGAECFVELGPGKALTGMVKKIDSQVGICNVENMESLTAAMEKIRLLQDNASKE